MVARTAFSDEDSVKYEFMCVLGDFDGSEGAIPFEPSIRKSRGEDFVNHPDPARPSAGFRKSSKTQRGDAKLVCETIPGAIDPPIPFVAVE